MPVQRLLRQLGRRVFQRIFRFADNKIKITPEERDKFLYILKRDLIGLGNLEPIGRDPYLEDIHVIGPKLSCCS